MDVIVSKDDSLLDLPKKLGSVAWNAIMKAQCALREGFEFRLGDSGFSFWFTNWLEVGKLAEKVLYVDIHDLDMRVKDVCSIKGNWNFNMLYTNIPTAICDRIKSVLISLNSLIPCK